MAAILEPPDSASVRISEFSGEDNLQPQRACTVPKFESVRRSATLRSGERSCRRGRNHRPTARSLACAGRYATRCRPRAVPDRPGRPARSAERPPRRAIAQPDKFAMNPAIARQGFSNPSRRTISRTVTVSGVDDFAFKRRHTHRTICWTWLPADRSTCSPTDHPDRGPRRGAHQ